MDQYGRLHIALVEGYGELKLACLLIVEIHGIGIVANFASGDAVGSGAFGEV